MFLRTPRSTLICSITAALAVPTVARAQEPATNPPPVPPAPAVEPAASPPSSPAEQAAALEKLRCTSDRDETEVVAPLLAGQGLEAVEPLYVSAGSTKQGFQSRLVGSSLKVRPLPNVTAERLDRAIECHAARAALGKLPAGAAPSSSDPFSLPGRLVEVDVASAKDGFKIAVRGESAEDAEQILARANAALESTAPPVEKKEEKPAEPFAFGDFTWLNGNNRQHKAVLDTPYFTPEFLLDVNYTASTNRPIDNTVVGSTALSRNNEITMQFLGFGGDFHYEAARARLMTQFGMRSVVVPRNDGSAFRGQYDLATALRYVSEAYGGVHINALNGINIDAGIFMSYVGLFSYDNFENWMYLPSYTSDNTPWFFNGVRVQIFTSDKLKIEPWLINGWQTYGKFTEMPGFGSQVLWRPVEWFSVLSNDYVGWDAQNNPGRMRFHSDNSVLVRYHNDPNNKVLPMAAFSFTGDIGGEVGDGVTAFGGHSSDDPTTCTGSNPCTQQFLSWMAYNRLWFFDRLLAFTMGGGQMHNPGRYLVLAPTGQASPFAQPLSTQGISYVAPTAAFSTNPGTNFDAWDVAAGFQYMPSEQVTYDLEFSRRAASVPYFAGHGGVTSPDGYMTTPTPSGWRADLVKSDLRIIAALLVRF